ncbi:MAG TPA: VWA domain-containing protein [Geminicoccaceae bacterium]|nr:VWA domain-containing protein [Geminicoccaceae bacterium]
MIAPLPVAARPFLAFPALLRAHGFAIAPEQTTAFMAATTLLGPRSIGDIRRAARATLAPLPERLAEFDALFAAFFEGRTLAAPTEGGPENEEEVQVRDEGAGLIELPEADEGRDAGEAATSAEALSARRFGPERPDEVLRRLAREAPARLPGRRARRRRVARRGDRIALRRVLRLAVRSDGELMQLPRLARRKQLRPVLLLIDVSGSMKTRTDEHLRLAHTLARTLARIEIFTLGTRLTRITRALRLKQRDQALAAAATMVADWGGGTRIGDALQAFLAVPRFAGFARGAYALVLSDGLERGEPDAMIDAVRRLARLAWRLDWLSPLAADPAFRLQTAGLAGSLPYIDHVADGSSVESIVRHVLGGARVPAP